METSVPSFYRFSIGEPNSQPVVYWNTWEGWSLTDLKAPMGLDNT